MGKPISKIAVILLSLDATAYHVAKNVPSVSDWNLELHAQKFAFALMLVFWLSLYEIAEHFVNFGEYGFARYMTLVFVVVGVTSLGFQKKVAAIEAEYNEHYPPMVWISFLVFIVVGWAYAFNSEIGHLPADYKGN